MACGINLAIIDNELFQFADAVPIGQGRFHLSALRRGVLGTAPDTHDSGADFVMASGDSLRAIELPSWAVGREARVQVQTQGGGLAEASAIVRAAPQTLLEGTGVAIAGQRVLGARQAAIALPIGGNMVDLEARAALGAALDAMRSHGLIET